MARKVFDCGGIGKNELERAGEHAEVEEAEEGSAAARVRGDSRVRRCKLTNLVPGSSGH